MQKIIQNFILFSFLILLLSPIYSMELPSDIVEISQIYSVFNHYVSKQEEPASDIALSYIISNNNEITNKELVYKNIFIPNPGQIPRVINSKPEHLLVTTDFEKVYFNSYNTRYTVNSSCSNAIKSYYSQKNEDLISSDYINLDNINYVIEKIITPRTKSSLVAYLSRNGISNPERCIADLEANKNLYSFPILFVLNSKIIGTKEQVGNGFSFEVKFEPEFLSPIKTQKFVMLFRKDPIQLSSIYTVPRGCENSSVSGQCYITQKDIENFNLPKIESPDGIIIDNVLHSLLDNLNVVSNFKDNSFENINTKELLVDLALKREQFCFRVENDNYNQIIFDTAKAYNLSLEQTFQLWAIISERSNCNYKLNPNLYGFAQVDLSGRDSGNLINIEQVTTNTPLSSTPSVANIDPRCFRCGPDYFISSNYPGSPVSVGGQTLGKGQVCYKCLSSSKAQRCNSNNGKVGGTVSMPADLKIEICPNIGSTQIAPVQQTTTIFNTFPLQLAEEEQFQYLALGDFKEINKHLLNNVYNNQSNQFYNLGYNGVINNSETYFGFLINAIKGNKDDFGSTILFTSDYLKELNYLVKTSRELSSSPYSFENFVIENNNSINMVYVLASLFNKDNASQIYRSGKFSDLFNSTAFFVKDGTNIKTTKEIRVLINYLAIKRKHYRDPQYFNKYNLSTNITTTKLNAYERLDYKYWDTKKNIYLKTLEDNNIKLMLKKDIEHYNYDKLLQVPVKENYPVSYVMDFGKSNYLNGNQYYPNPGAHAWAFDTKKEAIDNYTVIWEASDVCSGKNVCEETVPTERNCCKENKEVQDGKINYQYLDILVDGAILGIYNPTSKYNSENREYTHLAIYIGKTITGLPLIAESTADGHKISTLTREIRNRIKRIYVPKATNIKNIKDVILNPEVYPKTHIKLTNAQIAQLQEIKENRQSTTDYYENSNSMGEGDIENLEQNKYSAKILERARHYIGTPYILGGRNGYRFGPTNFKLNEGLDCVGLQYVSLRDLGYIDGTTGCKEMFENGCAVLDFIQKNKGHITGKTGILNNVDDLDLLRSGDLLFFNTRQGPFGHAAIYFSTEQGCHKYIHAPAPGSVVRYDCIESGINNNNTGNRRFPFQYARITGIDGSSINCNNNYITASNRQLSCCSATDYC